MARLSAAERAAKAAELRVALARLTRDGFGRFVRIERLRACEGGDCGLDSAQDWAEKYQQLDAALETVESLLASDDRDDRQAGRDVFLSFREAMREDAEQIERAQRGRDNHLLRQEYEASSGAGRWHAWLEDSREVEAVDLTGLEGRDAQRLALRLKQWNPNQQKVYEWRDGKRFLHPGVATLDLNDPTIVELGLSDDVWPVVREKSLRVTYEPRSTA